MQKYRKPDSNLVTYVKECQKTLDQSGFNDIDGLVLAELSYVDFSGVGIDLYSGNSISIVELNEIVNGSKTHTCPNMGNTTDQDLKDLIAAMAQSDRFKNMEVSNYVSDPYTNRVEGFQTIGEYSNIEQFAAITVTYENSGELTDFISYRGTDGTIKGWAENLAMFFWGETQNQRDAAAYLNIVGKQTNRPLRTGGHSKGAGDTEYSYLFCDDDVRARIQGCYLYDSPGLLDNIIKKSGHYEEFLEVANGLCPQDSVVGQLLHDIENSKYIYSIERGFGEHDPFSWVIEKSDDGSYDFVYVEQSDISKLLDSLLDRAAGDLSPEERQAFAETVIIFFYCCGEGEDGIGNVKDSILQNIILSYCTAFGGIAAFAQRMDVMIKLLKGKSIEDLLNLGKSLGELLPFISVLIGFCMEEWIESKLDKAEEKITNVYIGILEYICKMQNIELTIMNTFYDGIRMGIKIGVVTVSSVINSSVRIIGSSSATGEFKIDTALLRDYSGRIQSIINRANSLESRINNLYWNSGLLGLYNLRNMYLLTGYNYRLNRCIAYLNDTASDFENVEIDLNRKL